MSFIDELKRRNVFRVAAAYGVAAWVLLQVVDLVLDNVEAPGWVMDVFMLFVVIGFIVSVIVAWAYELTPEGIKREHEVDRSQSITGETGRKLDRIIIGFLAAAVLLLLADRFFRSPETAVPEQVAETTETTPEEAVVDEAIVETPAKSIAVLPFANMSEDAANEFFADGISEEILNALAKVRELKVAGRTSAFAFKGRNEDLREIGEALGVNHILEGSVRKAGNTVRVTAQLIQVSDGFHLWSETYDRELTDIFAIQDEIANAILLAMKAELVGVASIAATRTDTAAYEKYLLAKPRMHSRTREQLEVAAVLLAEATGMDPGFASAWAQRAIVTLLLSERQYGSIPVDKAVQDSKHYLDTALALEPENADALAGMGLWHRERPGLAEKIEESIPYLVRALELNPSNIDASNWLQLSYTSLGRDLEANAILEEMVKRDPLYMPGVVNLLWTYGTQGKIELAQQLLDRSRPYVASDGILADWEANVLLNAGRFAEALPYARASFEDDPENANRSLALAIVLSNLGEDEEVLELAKAIPFIRIFSLSRLGRNEEGLQIARDAANQRENPTLLMGYYYRSRQAESVVRLVEQVWTGLDDLHIKVRGFGGYGYPSMSQVAYAYKKTGNSAKFEEAMGYIRAEIDRQIEAEFDGSGIHYAESLYWALADNEEKAIEAARAEFDRNASGLLSTVALEPIFDDLMRNEEFRAIRLAMHDRTNEQRALAGLEPIEAEYSVQ